jgi:hypothetical protein
VIRRTLERALRAAARKYPVVTVTGPRQSGKSTLCRAAFPRKPVVSLEDLDVRDRATSDPRGFLEEIRGGAVLDEIQHAPGLLSYLQTEVDARPVSGRFVLTGSQHLAVAAGVAQSLAGRTAVLHLLPPSLDELRRFPAAPQSLAETLLAGAFPAIHDREIAPGRWLADYVATYVQRDVRQILAVGDLSAFTTFVRLCAGRTAQELNLSSLASDAGVSHTTARAWLSVLEAGWLVFRVPAWHRNAAKRWVKAPKLHWIDAGLVCHLLGIRDAAQLAAHPLRGPVFESWVASEALKSFLHRGEEAPLAHARAVRGGGADLVIEDGTRLAAVECKSGATVGSDSFAPLRAFAEAAGGRGAPDVSLSLVYGGEPSRTQSGVAVVSWRDVASGPWTRR